MMGSMRNYAGFGSDGSQRCCATAAATSPTKRHARIAGLKRRDEGNPLTATSEQSAVSGISESLTVHHRPGPARPKQAAAIPAGRGFPPRTARRVHHARPDDPAFVGSDCLDP